MHTYNVQARASGNTQVFASFSPKISTFWLLRVFSLCKILYPVSRHILLLQFYNIAANYLVFAICILKNRCKCCALIIASFTKDRSFAWKQSICGECLGYIGHNNTFTRPKDIVVFNQNVFKTPYMQHLLNMKKG